jgi:hypothetical protein
MVDGSKPHEPVVEYEDNPHGPLSARTIVVFTADEARALAHAAQPILLAFDGGRSDRPIIVGVIQTTTDRPKIQPVAKDKSSPARTIVDGREILLKGDERVELRCGEASIILTKAGKIIIRGAHLSTQSSGANRIRGASVEIN